MLADIQQHSATLNFVADNTVLAGPSQQSRHFTTGSKNIKIWFKKAFDHR